MGEAAAAAVRAVWAQDGPDAARQMYQRILALPPPGLAVFNAILDLEMASEASGPSKQGAARIQQVFEVSLRCCTLTWCMLLVSETCNSLASFCRGVSMPTFWQLINRPCMFTCIASSSMRHQSAATDQEIRSRNHSLWASATSVRRVCCCHQVHHQLWS